MADDWQRMAATGRRSDRLRILSVAYSLAPVTRNTSGGAEQVLVLVEEAITRAGHESIVIANEDSQVRGRLVATPRVSGVLDEEARAAACRRHRDTILDALRRPVDIIHYHGIDFAEYDVRTTVARIVTLHLPPNWYPQPIYEDENLFVVCVSESERAAAPRCDAVIPNGIDLAIYHPGNWQPATDDYFLAIGRICQEKNFHTAIDAARRAGVRLVLAGNVSRYPEHERYFAEEIEPRLDERRTYVGRAVFNPEKRGLIAGARAVIVPSTVAETSSIVSMEALACGTPVIAMRSGALPEIVDHGVTGFVVDDEEQMVDAIRCVGEIDRATCRRVAEERFDGRLMGERYLAVYERLAAGRKREPDHVAHNEAKPCCNHAADSQEC
jgi:glycosyltransferase involved in cell wall biosynthesis